MCNKKIISALSVLAALAVACSAQPSGSQAANTWGPSVQGVQMSIELTTNLIPVGTKSVAISAEIKNSSADTIYFGESNPETDFDAVLINDTGKKYQLTPPAVAFSRLIRAELAPGGSRKWTIPVGVNKYFRPPRLSPTEKNVKPGLYTLKASRNFTVNGNTFELESNSLKVRLQ